MYKITFIKRLKLAASKLIFCLSTLADPVSFIKLAAKAKKFSSNRNNLKALQATPDVFSFKINLAKSTKQIWLRTYSGDIDMFFESFWKNVYAIDAIKEAKYIVDVGANIGMSTLFFLKRFPKAHVIAIEPDASNYALLNKNCKEEIEQSKVQSIHAAVFSYDTKVHLQKSVFAYNSRITELEKGGEPVLAISMNTLTKSYNLSQIDILKIDIEDGEKDLLSGHTEWLNCVKNIIIEIHSKESKNIFEESMSENGFEIEELCLFDSSATICWAYKKR